MATQSKKEKQMLRQAVPVAPSPQAEAADTAPPSEPIAQMEGNLGDRIAAVLWILGALALVGHFVIDTIAGFLF